MTFLLLVMPMLMIAGRGVHCEFSNGTGLTLDLVQVVFRHGERSPNKLEAVLVPSVSRNLEERWGLAQLTSTGKRQEYELGKMLRQKYDDFLGKVYRPTEVFSISSNFDRTMASLQLVLAALFPLSDDLVWADELKWSPATTYSTPWELDNFFNLIGCPKYGKFYDQLMNSTAMRKRLQNYDSLFKVLDGVIPKKKMDLEQVFYLNSLVLSMKIFKTPMPKWWTKELGEEIRKAAKFYLETLSYNPELIKLNGGAMVKRMLRNMNSTSKRKVYLYSGHEFTVYALAKAHKVTLDQSPPFGSALILEKHRDAQGHSYVKMHLWTGPTQKLVPIGLGSCGEFCPMKEYEDLVRPMLPSDEDTRCLYKIARSSDLERYFSFEQRGD